MVMGGKQGLSSEDRKHIDSKCVLHDLLWREVAEQQECNLDKESLAVQEAADEHKCKQCESTKLSCCCGQVCE